MHKSPVLLLAVILGILSGGGVLALGQQQRAYEAARASYETSLDSLHDALDSATRAAADEDVARTELSDVVEKSERALDALGRTAPALAAVVAEVGSGSKLLDAPHENMPSAPDMTGRHFGTDEYLRAADKADATVKNVKAFVAESGSRTEALRAASERVDQAWSDAAKKTAGEIDAALASNPNSTDASKSTLQATSAKLQAADFGLSDEVVGLWAAVPAGLTKVSEEEAAYQAQKAAEQAAAAAAASYRGGSGGGYSGGGYSGGGSYSGGGGAASGGGGGGGGVAASEAGGVLAATNAQRAANGLGALSNNGILVSYACSWASALATQDSGLSHSSFPGGFSFWGENVAAGFGSANGVVSGWMGSPGHRANILNGSFTQMGACVAQGRSGTLYWVQQFGR